MEVRVSRGSAAVVQRVPADRVDWFLQWQREVSAAAEGFAGFRGTDVYPPAEGRGDQWIAVIHFDEADRLKAWLESPQRAQLVGQLRARIGDFELRELSGGFGPWFACVAPEGGAAPPPAWKMALVVLLGLYPTVMVLTLFPGPALRPLGLALSMLIGNALSVAILQWGVMPRLSKLFAKWLTAAPTGQRFLSVGGVLAILGLLAGLVLLFRPLTG